MNAVTPYLPSNVIPIGSHLWDAPRVGTLLFDLEGPLLELQWPRLFTVSLTGLAMMRFRRLLPPSEVPRVLWDALRACQSHMSAETNYEAFVRAMRAHTRGGEGELRQALRRFIRDDFPRMAPYFSPVAQARTTLLLAHQWGYRLVLAASPLWPEEAMVRALTWAGLGDIPFAFMAHGENMTRAKPHVAFYRELLGRLGLSGSDCVMIGHEARRDLPATEVGIRTFLVRRFGEAGSVGVLDSRLDGYGTYGDLQRWLWTRASKASVVKPSGEVPSPLAAPHESGPQSHLRPRGLGARAEKATADPPGARGVSEPLAEKRDDEEG